MSRMKTVSTSSHQEKKKKSLETRFVAVSATAPNIADLAKWLVSPKICCSFVNFDCRMK